MILDPQLLMLELRELEDELLDLIEIVGDEQRHFEVLERWEKAQRRVAKFRHKVQVLVDNSSKE